MPELPEVAVLAQDLARLAKTGPLTAVHFKRRQPHFSRIFSPEACRALGRLVGTRVQVSSRGKHLWLASSSAQVGLHLGMTGQFRIAPIPREYRKHHFMTLRWGTTECCYMDFRRFSRFYTSLPAKDAALGGFSPKAGFALRKPAELAARLPLLSGSLSVPRITWLLRHGALTGVGNYLANEALGRLRLSPFEPCRDRAEALAVLKECQHLARQSFRAGGTSFGIGYFRLDGSEGAFAEQLVFYRRPGVKRTNFRNRSVYSHFGGQTS